MCVLCPWACGVVHLDDQACGGRAGSQVQGLMEVFDRQWCNVFLWTPNGAALYHVPRDTAYWRACFDVLAEFWWAHVVPAKHALAAGKQDAVELCRCAFVRQGQGRSPQYSAPH